MNKHKLEKIARNPIKRAVLELFIDALLLLQWVRNIPRRWVLWQAGADDR